MKIVCMLNSNPSYQRIKNSFEEHSITWQHETELDNLRITLSTDYIDLALIDHSINHFDDIIDLLEFKNVKMLIFRGNYDEIMPDLKQKVNQVLLEEEEDERVLETDHSAHVEESKYKVMTREVIKTQKIEVEVVKNLANSIISVVNLSQRAGSSFIAQNLAKAFSDEGKEITLFETPVGSTDYYYAMGFYDYDKSYYSYREHLKKNGKIDKRSLPVVNGVSVAVNEPETNDIDWNETDSLRLLASNSGISIFDLGWGYKDSVIYEFIKASKTILVVVDPIPTQIVQNEERLLEFEKLKSEGMDVRFVFNKWHETINEKRFIEGFGIEPFMKIPYIEPEIIYQQNYKTAFNYLIEHEKAGSLLRDSLAPLLDVYADESTQNVKKRKRFIFF
ncbi:MULTISPECIES: hypothetical protein [Bacillaceae]|uniref:AAA domain-containing protein n=2 Tax=Bacillaceae TaxID=186817 RepID=A0A7V7UTF5_9BACI|nr:MULTISPECIES: hypothetical protein [Bacillaceae]KAB2329456.1 hypothetical protein F7732_21260 [Bacillus mesophilum]QVY63933.1 hypothetical protein J1899_22430 [Cytobacillus gottheilii]